MSGGLMAEKRPIAYAEASKHHDDLVFIGTDVSLRFWYASGHAVTGFRLVAASRTR